MNLLTTSLHEKHKNLNAKMAPFAGFDMPIQYNNLKEEVLAVRNEIGMFDVSHMGEFILQGKDALSAIDYLVTNDIRHAEMKKAIYSPLCREDGTIIDDLIVYKLKDDLIFLCVNASNIEKDFNWIRNNIKDFDVDFKNVSSEYSLIAVQGPKTFETLKKTSLLNNLEDISYFSIKELNNPNNSLTYFAARTGYTGEDGFEIFAGHQEINKLWDELINLGVTPCGLGARDVLRLEVSYPLYGHELTDEVTPLDTGLKWCVKLQKENFIGKTTLLNQNPKFKIVKFTQEKGISRADYPIFSEDNVEIGKVTSGTLSPTLNKSIGIGLIKKDFDGEKFHIDIRGKKYEAMKINKPFVSGGHKK